MKVEILDGTYDITSDEYCYTLTEIRPQIKDPSKTSRRVIGYFPSIETLFEEVASREGRLNEAESMKEYIEHLENIHTKMESMFDEIKQVIGMKTVTKRTIKKNKDVIERLTEK